MSKQSLLKLGQIYGNMLNGVKVVEEKSLPTKAGPGAKELDDKGAADLQDGGPQEKGGFKEPEIDAKKIKGKENEYEKNLTSEEEEEENVEKSSQRAINNFMSKSIFDKLYENVMAGDMSGTEDAEGMELDALGIDAGDEGAGDEIGDEEVTITLSKELAQKLHDALMSVVGEAEGEVEDSAEDMAEDAAEGESEGGFGGEEDEEEMGHAGVNAKKPNMGEKGNNKVNMKLKPASSSGGDGKYTDEVKGDAGDLGHALVNAKKPNMGEKGNNKVSGQTKTGKVGSDFFA